MFSIDLFLRSSDVSLAELKNVLKVVGYNVEKNNSHLLVTSKKEQEQSIGI